MGCPALQPPADVVPFAAVPQNTPILLFPAQSSPLKTRIVGSEHGIRGWTYSISDIEFELDEERGISSSIDEGDFNRRYGGGRNVTITLPGGERTTFVYRLRFGGGFHYYAEWEAPLGTYAKLEPTCDNSLAAIPNFFPYWEAAGPSTPMEAFEFPGYILTMKDGTKYHIEREYIDGYTEFDPWTGETAYIETYGEATLRKIEDRQGNDVVFRQDRSGIDHYNALGDKTKSVEFERDGNGRITAIRDPKGVDLHGMTGPAQITYEYDANGNLIKINKLKDDTDTASPVYETTEFRYEEPSRPHYITSIVDPRGIEPMKVLYDDDGRMVGMVDAYDNEVTFEHNLGGKTETTHDRMGNPTIHSYDERGNVTVTIDAQGNRTSRTYDALNNETSVTDANGNTTSSTYDSEGNRTSVTDALGNTTHYTYDTYGNQLSVTDPLGNVTSNAYDGVGNLISTANALGQTTTNSYDMAGNLAETRDALGNVTANFGYDSEGNMTSTTDRSGVTRSFSYDSNGNQTGTSFQWVNPNDADDVRNVTTQTIYNAAGQVVETINAEGNHTFSLYNAIGKPESTTDELGNETVTLYDARGNAIEIQYPRDATHPSGTITRTVYDANGRAVVTVDRHTPGTSANGSRTVYNSIGRVIRSERLENVVIDLVEEPAGSGTFKSVFTSSDPATSSTSNVYDAVGRVLESTNAEGYTTCYEYDAIGRRTAITDPFGHRTLKQYDCKGRQVLVRDALGRDVTFQYDVLDRRVRMAFADGSGIDTTYDALGRRIGETDQAGVTRDFEYNTQGHLTAVLLPEVPDPEDNGALKRPRYQYAYDVYGRLTTIRDPKGRETKFTYDELGRQMSRELPLGQIESQVYNSLGQLESKTDFKGQVTEFLYDALGRVSTKNLYAFGSTTPDQTIQFTFDELGRQKDVIEARGTTTASYDENGRVKLIASPEGAISYEYDRVTGRKTRTHTANSDISYDYDELGRLSSVTVTKLQGVTLSTPEVTTYSYTEVGSRESMVLPNGVTALYSYDGLNRLTNLSHYNSANELLAGYSYSLAPTGRRTGVQEQRREADSSLSSVSIQYTYDELNRLTREASQSADRAEANFTADYTYDLVGNRLAKVQSGNEPESIAYTFDANDRLLTEVSDVDGTTAYGYSDNGEQISKVNALTSESVAYGYNLEGRLSSATISRIEDGHNVDISSAYEYSQRGIRTKAMSTTTIDSGTPYDTTRIFLNDGMNHTGYSQVLEELPTLGGTPTKSYVLGDDVLGQADGSGTKWLGYDGHGSTRLLADSTGAITDRLSYDAYGVMLDGQPNVTSPAGTDLTYAGEQYDHELGMGYNRARYYNMQAGVWNRVDPHSGIYRDPQSLHKYAYCHLSPPNGVDPTGKFTLLSLLSAVGTIATMISFLRPVSQVYAGAKGLLNLWQEKQRIASSWLPEICKAEMETFLTLLATQCFRMIFAAFGEFAKMVLWEVVENLLFAAAFAVAAEIAGAVFKKIRQTAAVAADTTGVRKLDETLETGIEAGGQRFNQERRFWREKVDFEGNTVYQRNDLFDPDQVTTWTEGGVEFTGTNVTRMSTGRAPVGFDGGPVNLHHMTQAHTGPIAEVSQTFHRSHYSTIHINTGSLPSGINRGAFNTWRELYWAHRALEFL